MSTRNLYLMAVILAVLGLGLLALPTAVRALPGRYAVRLPGPLYEMWTIDHPSTLPTPVSPGTGGAHLLLTPQVTPTPTPSPPPSASPAGTATPQPLFTPTPTPTPLPAYYFLTGLTYERQGWNNCGPTTLLMAMSFWGYTDSQQTIAAAVKPNPEDKNVSPEELAAYAESRGLRALVRVNGDLELMKRFIALKYPVIVETWYIRSAEDQLGHYRLLTGYDDGAQRFMTYDSLHGPDEPISYAEFDELWRVFNRTYIVLYTPKWQWEVEEILGEDMDPVKNYEHAVARAQEELRHPPSQCVIYPRCSDYTMYGWFNLGSSLTALGRYEEAAVAFDEARRGELPWRMLWYQFGPYEAYYAAGRYQDVLDLATPLLEATKLLEESLYWRGKARLALKDVDGARKDFQAALKYHPDWEPARTALQQLP